MTREEKLMKVHALFAEVSDVLVDRFFDADSEELLDEKIEVLTALKDGKPPDQIPNYYSVLENFSPFFVYDRADVFHACLASLSPCSISR